MAGPSFLTIATAITLSVGLVTLAYFLFSRKKRPVALNPNEKIQCQLLKKDFISHDTRLFRFALQSPEHILGLPVGKHIMISTKLNDKLESRAYTPTSSDDDIGYFDLVIKVYFKNVHPKFPDGGKVTQYLESLQIGDCIDVLGPKGAITYLGSGNFKVEDKLNKKNPPTFRKSAIIGMIAGGSGITPMYQIMKHILKHPEDRTTIYLLYANQTEDDILLRQELEECTKDPRVKVWYLGPARRWLEVQFWLYQRGNAETTFCARLQ